VRRFESLSGQRFSQLFIIAVLTGAFWEEVLRQGCRSCRAQNVLADAAVALLDLGPHVQS
jgi:hypothetical protein